MDKNRRSYGSNILESLNEVVAWTKGDKDAATIVEWTAPTSVDVRLVRSKLGMSQKEFAACFGLKLEALRNWEQAKRVPDTSARVLLTIIDREPDAVKKALSIG